jgi:hypothetical protein
MEVRISPYPAVNRNGRARVPNAEATWSTLTH